MLFTVERHPAILKGVAMKKEKPERERKYTFNVIPTKYKGWNFRSRLEARWAIYFDGLEIPYIYEPEGVPLWGGLGVYLPDFYLPKHHGGVYAEVKPNEFTEEELKKCRMLCRMSKKAVILLDGAPEPIWYKCYYFDEHVCESDVTLHTGYTQTQNRFYMGAGDIKRDMSDWLTEQAERALFISRSSF